MDPICKVLKLLEAAKSGKVRKEHTGNLFTGRWDTVSQKYLDSVYAGPASELKSAGFDDVDVTADEGILATLGGLDWMPKGWSKILVVIRGPGHNSPFGSRWFAGIAPYAGGKHYNVSAVSSRDLVDALVSAVKDRTLGELFGIAGGSSRSVGSELRCNECGKVFRKVLRPGTVEVQCPKCGGFDTEVA